MRAKIDEMFDSVTENLVLCGKACLERLCGLVLADVKDMIVSEIFTPEWEEGEKNPVLPA